MVNGETIINHKPLPINHGAKGLHYPLTIPYQPWGKGAEDG